MPVSVQSSSYVRAENNYFGIDSGVPPFGKELITRFIVCSPSDVSFYYFNYFMFWFEGRIFVLIVPVPDQY